jgi:3-methyladenine DNA glycosylase AlkD
MEAMHRQLAAFVSRRLRAAAVPSRVAGMQAYLKTTMPCYGVAKPGLVPIFREMKRRFVPAGRRQYEAGIRTLWRLAHREEKYAALEYATQHKGLVTSASLVLYERLVREGAWWDLVDYVAANLVSPLYLAERKTLRGIINRWIDDEDMWIRRAAILAHLRHKHRTDQRQLFAHCLRRSGEREFFIRKAIGWALRQYSYANPQGVRRFLLANRDRLSPLSFREGAKALVRKGLMRP